MNKKELQAIAEAAAKNIKTEDGLNQFRKMLTKITVETALNAELQDHLGFGKGEQSDAGNNRNGYTSKILQTEEGQFELVVSIFFRTFFSGAPRFLIMLPSRWPPDPSR